MILALTGRPDVGKDTVGEILCHQFGFVSVAFADALRLEVTEAWRIDARMLTWRPSKETPVPALAVGMCSNPAFRYWILSGGDSLLEPRSPRWTLQRWASHKRRFVPNYYAAIVDRWIEHHIGIGRNRLVVTDLRDEVEESMLRAKGARVVRIHRPQAAALPIDTATHVSELHHLIKAYHDIVNEGCLQALVESVAELVQDLTC
ncbi:hypothetical protein D8B23_12765 [Verminephrobacter aporrectodeae subsp. tuberculatae]|nr:hypothetical protein [Verminephrobacter aporrectodeae subsp. tuberculatae]MCW8207658.1 hypothetical protein [Verminephrobacter aporrectodeae subsp. tuberculatae]